jgi:hypothetical protein
MAQMAHDDTRPDSPAHVPSVRRGEERAKPQTVRTTRLAGDASGINVADRKPIDPRMPSLPPA